MEKFDIVHAVKNGTKGKFSRRSWDAMGTDKCGWVEIPATPKEVVAHSTASEIPNPIPLKNKKKR